MPFATVPPPPGTPADVPVPRCSPLETDIDVFRSVIDYRRYQLTISTAYMDPDADLLLQKLKCKSYLLYRTLEASLERTP